MKKIYFGLIIALVLCSCTKTELTGVEAGEMIIGASMEVYPSISKAALSDTDGSLTWQNDDVIEVATSEGHAQFNLKTGAGTASATFSANYSGTLGDYATYPADIFDSESKIKIPASREWSEGNTNCSMFGSVDGDNVAFKHLGGVVKVTLNGVPVNAKKFVFSTPGKKITGEFDFKTGTDNIKYIETADDSGNANSSYTLSFNLSEAKNMAFYIPLPYGTYPKFAFKLLGDDAANPIYEFEGISEQTVGRKDILLMPAATISEIQGGGDGDFLKSVPSGTNGDYTLPDAESVILYFEGKQTLGTDDVINLKYNGSSQLPKKLCLKVKNGNKVNISGELPNTHVEFDQGEIVTASLRTSATTFKIVAPAKISEKLVVKGGNVEISGPIEGADNVKAIEVEAGATADGSSAPVQITIAENATIGTSGTSGENGGITTSANVVIVNNTTQEVNVTVPTDVQETVQVASAGTGTGEVKRSDNQPTTNLEAVIGTQNFFTLEDAFASVREGQTIEITKADTYTVPNISYNITVEGAVTGVVFNCEGSVSIASIPNGSTFKNVTMNFGNSGYHGFQHAGHITMTECTLNGLFFSYGDMTFTDCTFNQTASEYSMWCYAGDVTYRNCTINCNGKFANVYNEGNALTDGDGNHIPWKVVAEGCTFNSTKTNKAALNIKATCGAKPLYYEVEIKNCTANGENWPAASTSESLVVGSALWQVDDINSSVASKIKVTVDDTVVYISPNVQ